MSTANTPRLSGALQALRTLAESKPLTFGAFLDELNHRGHAFLCLVLGIPFLTPLPLPGLSMPFGLLILVVSICMVFGLPPWVPRFLAEKQLPQAPLVKVLDFSAKMLGKLEYLIRPRGIFFAKFPGIRRIAGLSIASCAALLALPLPPGTNFPPALAIVLVALGVLERDSLVLGLGFLVATMNVLIFSAVAVFGFEYIAGLWHT